MRDTAGEVKTNSQAVYAGGTLHMDEIRSDDRVEPIYNGSMPIQDIVWKISRERWTIEMGGEKEIRAGSATL